eukprot:gene3022-18367_t
MQSSLFLVLVLSPVAAFARTCVNADVESCWLGICSGNLYVPEDCTRLHLNADKLYRANPAAIATALTRDPPGVSQLAELRVETVKNGDSVGIAVAEALKTNTALAAVELYNTELGDDGAKAIADALSINTALKILLLHRNRVANKGATAIAAALKLNTGGLETLSLHANRVGSEGARALASALAVNSKLRVFRLNKNQISDMGATAIAAAVKLNFALSLLDIRDNQVHTKGLQADIKASVDENRIQTTREAKARRATGRAGNGELCSTGSECSSGTCKIVCCSSKGQPSNCLECGLVPSHGDCIACDEGLTLERAAVTAVQAIENTNGGTVSSIATQLHEEANALSSSGVCRKQTAKEKKLRHAAEVAADERADFNNDEAERVAKGTLQAKRLEQAGQDKYQWVLTSPFEFQTSEWLPVDHAVTIKAQVVGKAGIKVGIRTELGRDYGLSLAACCHAVGGVQRANAEEAQQSCVSSSQCTKEGEMLYLGWDPARKSGPFTFQANSTAPPVKLFQRIRIEGRVRLYAHLERGSHLGGLTVLSKEEAFQAEMYRRGASKVTAAGDSTDDNVSCLRRERKKCFASNHDACCGEVCWPVCQSCDSATTDDGGFCMCFPVGFYRDDRLVSPGGACLLPPGVGEENGDAGNVVDEYEANNSPQYANDADDAAGVAHDGDNAKGNSPKVDEPLDKLLLKPGKPPSKLREKWENRQEL